MQHIPRRFGKAPAGQDDSCVGTQCGDGRYAGSNPPEQTAKAVPPGVEGGERWELEADTRHVEILVSQMGLGDQSKCPPDVRMTDEDDAGQQTESRQV